MIPQSPNRKDYEKVALGEFIFGVIEKVEYDMQHKSNYQGQEKVGPAARLKFRLDGYQFPHCTRWMSFSYAEKSNLFTKYLSKLVDNAEPDMKFDLDKLTGMNVKTLWAEKNDFQFVESIWPADKKIPFVKPTEAETEIKDAEATSKKDDLPF